MCEEEILCQKKVEVEDNKEILHNNVLGGVWGWGVRGDGRVGHGAMEKGPFFECCTYRSPLASYNCTYQPYPSVRNSADCVAEMIGDGLAHLPGFREQTFSEF